MATKAQIRQRVGEDLNLVPIGQDLEAQDKNRIDTTYTEVYNRLKKESLAVWASDASVPEEVTPYYIDMMLEKLLTSYSVPPARYERIKRDAGDNGDIALANIAELVIPEYESIESDAGF